MRIAVSGAHAVGKSTLVDVLAAVLVDFVVIQEPYDALLESGYIFGDPPVPEDFEVQLEHSLTTIDAGSGGLLFDRTPADLLAYLAVIQRRKRPDAMVGYWNDVVAAMKRIDLIVYVPVERPDRIRVPESEYPRLRKSVDEELRRLLVEDELGMADKVIEVRGSVADRTEQVIHELGKIRACRS